MLNDCSFFSGVFLVGTGPGQNQDPSGVAAAWDLLFGVVRREVEALLLRSPSLSVGPAPELSWLAFWADLPGVWSSPVLLPLALDSWTQDQGW